MASQQFTKHNTEHRDWNNSGISRTPHWYRTLRLALSCLLIVLAYSQLVPAAHAAPGITVTPTSGLQTSETGGTAYFTVALNQRPTANVTIDLSTSDATEGTVGPASLTFTPANWSVAQMVTVTGVNENLDDGDIAYTIVTAAAVSADAGYSGLNASDVSVTNRDDDTAGLVVTQISRQTNEAGNTAARSATFTVRLSSQPTSNVTVAVASSDTSEGAVSPASLTFTTANWNTAQTVTVTGANDFSDDGHVAYNVTLTPSGGGYTAALAKTIPVYTQDDDLEERVTISNPSNLTVTEAAGAGRTATFTVVLNENFGFGMGSGSRSLTLAISSSKTSRATVSPASITFTNNGGGGNVAWNSAQTVTITGVDNSIDDDNEPLSINITATTGGSSNPYNNNASRSVPTIPFTVIDNDTAGMTVSTPANTTTTEAGGTATFTVVLNSQPTADVTIPLSSNNTTEGTVSPTSLTFTAANWNTAQTVTVTGVNDDVDDGDIAYTIVTGPTTSTDPVYNVLNPADRTFTNTDDDTVGVTLSAISGNTTEAGGTATFTAVLDSEPTADVTIDLTSNDTNEGTVDPATLTFTPANWNVAQTVTITGVDDAADDGDVAYEIALAVSSSDTTYNALSIAAIDATNIDNDGPGFTISPLNGLNTTEAGGTATFTIVLDMQPTANVTIELNSSNTDEGTVNPSTLTFTTADWNVAQTVTVTGVDDNVDDGDIAYTIVTEPAQSSDPAYDAFDAANVSVTNTDDDTAGIAVTPINGLVTTEAGGKATFTVKLNSQPTANVTIGLSSSDTTEGTVSPTTLTFTSADWNTAKIVTVTGVNDNLDDGDINYTIVTAPATSADANYAGIDAANVSARNTDDDTAGVTVSAISGSTTEKGGTATFTVKLNSQPTANVTIGLTSSDTTEGTVNPTTLTFTPANWNTAQTVTIKGVKDTINDGNITYKIITSAATSADAKYNGMAVADVTVINIDDPSSIKNNWQVFMPFIRR